MASSNASAGVGTGARPAAPTHHGDATWPAGWAPRVAHIGLFRILPHDLRDSILRLLVPHQDCIRSPYGFHDCALSYGP